MRTPAIVMGLFVIALIICGCARPRVSSPSAPARVATPDWIDLQPHWRVRVVTPVLASGGYLVKTEPPQAAGAEGDHAGRGTPRDAVPEITLSAPGLIGYEVSFYRVSPRQGGGVRVAFDSAEVHRHESVLRSRRPIQPLFTLPSEARWVRILHLARGRQEYDSAILAAARRDTLESLTRQVEADPAACKSVPDGYCVWIPAGIAAIPEERRTGGEWNAAY